MRQQYRMLAVIVSRAGQTRKHFFPDLRVFHAAAQHARQHPTFLASPVGSGTGVDAQFAGEAGHFRGMTGWAQAISTSPFVYGFGCRFDDVTRARTYNSFPVNW